MGPALRKLNCAPPDSSYSVRSLMDPQTPSHSGIKRHLSHTSPGGSHLPSKTAKLHSPQSQSVAAELSVDTKHVLVNEVNEWLQTTHAGGRLSALLSSFTAELRSGAYDWETLARVLCWTQESGRSLVHGKVMPYWLYALVFGKEDEKELCEDEVLKELLLNEDPINFILNSCAERMSALQHYYQHTN